MADPILVYPYRARRFSSFLRPSYKHVMSWLFRFLMMAVVAAGCMAGWSTGALVARDMKVLDSAKADDGRPGAHSSSGPALSAKVSQALGALNAEREARKDSSGSRTVYLERVSFERSAGGVVARGSVSDWGFPRHLNVVIDAFDGAGNYVSSSSSGLDTVQGSTQFSVSMDDQDAFQRFSVRFLDAGMEEVVMRSADTPARKIPPLLADDPLQPADLGEVADRMVLLGYAEKAQPVRDEIVASALIRRFRLDYGISGPPGITIGDLLALRQVSPPVARLSDLAGY